ncbi:hypothetical protein WMY93_027031 [Mugilogobius chulae]|uniref:C-type lectin domain-containing protein n=1 Tax=Mugilogobius chulae TaxID=88201 RepID=A0AAW0N200_9GOBI
MDALILILLLNGFERTLSYHTEIYEYHAISLAMTWTDAQQYCREHYTDLATFRNMDDINSFQRPSTFTGDAWIGLFDDPASWERVMGNESNSWRWSSTGTTSPGGYQNWKSSEPDLMQQQTTVGFYITDFGVTVIVRLYVHAFIKRFQTIHLYFYTMTWDEAQSYCRQHHTDLAMIEDETENSAAASVLVENQWAWFGLYRKPFRWSDGSDSDFKNWMTNQPNNVGESQHCVWESDAHEWNDMPCSWTRPFVCANGEFGSLEFRFWTRARNQFGLRRSAPWMIDSCNRTKCNTTAVTKFECLKWPIICGEKGQCTFNPRKKARHSSDQGKDEEERKRSCLFYVTCVLKKEGKKEREMCDEGCASGSGDTLYRPTWKHVRYISDVLFLSLKCHSSVIGQPRLGPKHIANDQVYIGFGHYVYELGLGRAGFF